MALTSKVHTSTCVHISTLTHSHSPLLVVVAVPQWMAAALDARPYLHHHDWQDCCCCCCLFDPLYRPTSCCCCCCSCCCCCLQRHCCRYCHYCCCCCCYCRPPRVSSWPAARCAAWPGPQKSGRAGLPPLPLCRMRVHTHDH